MKPYRKDLKPLGRQLRSEMTAAEQALWQRLRNCQISGLQFYRQKPLLNFIVDFYCPKAKVVIEVDGGQHYEEDSQRRDSFRDEALKDLGLRILRFDDRQVLTELEGVLEVILQIVTARSKAT